MSISGVETASLAANVSQNDSVGISVLKKALDIQEQSALKLIESIPQASGNSGQNINIKV
ncbi:YjfB family protein [sulfur-oxidizing endosymbiont of Gigantopelta aegis]|uniref:YjfB family protein n=1 Tax=sulfur-oxidizing endosymbiont of Gigantopelta aegis TaxID=2794934 RepID=UPI0018DB980F|nr:YjfB family protein [sulfur-oxidizing endosymbiont of Gigantopelta aegis]